jgi:catechol 2,3-dioxygenase-like lactoylglutathione lyase family enzyme
MTTDEANTTSGACETKLSGLVHHIELYVCDLQRSTEFWGWLLEELGYTLYQEWPQGKSWILGATYIDIVQAPEANNGPKYHRRNVGLNHIAFHVESERQVDEFTEKLRARGVKLLYQDRHPFAGGPNYYAVFFEDPDGIKLELAAS